MLCTSTVLTNAVAPELQNFQRQQPYSKGTCYLQISKAHQSSNSDFLFPTHLHIPHDKDWCSGKRPIGNDRDGFTLWLSETEGHFV